VQIGGRTVQAVIRELLEKAEATGKGGDVAQYLVGAKLELRLEIQLPKHGANLADKRSKRGSAPRPGDHEIEDAVFEVALGPPDEKHLEQTAKALKTPRRDVWLLTRNEHVGKWREGIAERDDIDLERVVVSSIEMFVGQNLAELAGFSSDSKIEVLTELCRVYNEQWIETVGGTPGMRIELTP
jgi:hypothetical protein